VSTGICTATTRSLLAAGIVCGILALAAGCRQRDARTNYVESEIGYRLPDKETHFTFTVEAVPGDYGKPPLRPAMTFRVPREYVDLGHVLRNGGQIKQVPLDIELPGPTPWQSRPWLKDKKGTPEYEEFMKGWIGKFIVTLGSGSGDGGRELFLGSQLAKIAESPSSTQGMLQDGSAYGLVRYSPIRCYTPEHLKDPSLKRFLESKPADDPMHQSNCRVDRGSAVYFSPPTVTNSDEVVFIECHSPTADCSVSFDLERQGISTQFGYEKLARWTEIVTPTRDLIRSFIVRAESPALPTSSPR
jgi:hypothetical protein